MRKCRKVGFVFQSNSFPYKVEIFDGNKTCETTIFDSCQKICITTNSTCFYIVASTLNSVNAKTIYANAYMVYGNCYFLNLDFNRSIINPQISTLPIQRFSLTDRNYGFGIDGTLNFVGVA